MNAQKIILLTDHPEHQRGVRHALTMIGGNYFVQDCKTITQMKETVSQEEGNIVLILVEIKDYLEDLASLVFWLREQKNMIWIAGIAQDISSADLVKCIRLGMVDLIGSPFSIERIKHMIQKAVKMQDLANRPRTVTVHELDYVCLQCCCTADPERVLPKGYNQKTYKRIYQYLVQSFSRKFTSSELAQELGISRITARRYLDLLEMTHKIEMEMSYGKAGRPTNRYRIKTQIHENQGILGE